LLWVLLHLKSDKHKKNVRKAENKTKKARQTTLHSNNTDLNEHEVINTALVKAFIQADIPLEKVDKLKDFF
jgi:ribosomal protein L17